MSSLRACTFEGTLELIEQFLHKPHPNQVIDQNLHVVEKKGFRWILLSLLAPFYRFFGEDVYSHVRVNQVADRVLELCEQNHAQLNKHIIQNIKNRILTPLNDQTKRKYQAHFNAVTAKLDAMTYSQIPDKYLKPYVTPNTDVIGMTKQQQMEVLEILFPLLGTLKTDPEKYSLQFVKTGKKQSATRKLRLWEVISRSTWESKHKKIAEVDVPFSLHIEMRRGLIHDIILLAKAVVGEGAQTKVRACYGLLTDRLLVRKKIPADQREVLKTLLERNVFSPRLAPRGLVAVEIWKEKLLSDAMHDRGLQLFELKLAGTLDGALVDNRNLCGSVAVKKQLMGDLLHGIRLLHTQRHPGFVFTPQSARRDLGDLSWAGIRREIDNITNIPPFKIAHGDLKPGNVLVAFVENKLRAQITDFGSLNPAMLIFTTGFTSPEKIAFDSHGSALLVFHENYAQPSDMWSLGLICVMILSGKFSEKRPGFAPLPSMDARWIAEKDKLGIQQITKENEHERTTIENKVLSQITQAEIDQDLAALAKDSSRELKPFWELVSRMLRIPPKNRITAAEAVEEFEKASSDSKVDN